ncbi:hypothetical protein CMI47_01790 [Candidatus Pacearchaeota archaeon]|nr:hypothetical protein [Candidatus Pacearchaeota archaeon]|tara:strand:+ start:6364 stop:7731 length:1368 start_codon:yes stop_codon:yes gene_type:complete
MINKLINLATYLNKTGFSKEADELDWIIKKSYDFADNPAGVHEESFARSTGNSGDLDRVSRAIDVGDASDAEIRTMMREEATPEIIELCASEIADALDEFIAENPGINTTSDLSNSKKVEIKKRATKYAIEEYKRRHSEEELIGDYLNEVYRRLGIDSSPPGLEQLLQRYLYDFIYQFVFGFIDNFVLIIAASVLDKMLESTFGAKGFGSLVSAGAGNLISDVMGDVGGVTVEEAIESTSLARKMATDEQLELASPLAQLLMESATTTGVAAGCIVGAVIGLAIVKGVGSIALVWSAARAGEPIAQAVLQASRAGAASISSFEAIAAATITTGTITVGAIASLVAAGVLGVRWKMTQNALDEMTIKSLESSQKIITHRLHKIYNEENPNNRLGRGEFTNQHFLEMLATRRPLVQKIWDEEMSLKAFAGNPDINKNLVFEWVEGLSRISGLDNPNV